MSIRVNATYKLTGWNTNQLRQRVPVIMEKYRAVLDRQLKKSIQAPQFSWTGRETRRRNGQIVGSPRNIVDTGAFLRSQRFDRPNPTTILFTWGNDGVNYAGFILRGTGPAYPPRDWIGRALEAAPFEQFFTAEWRRLSRKSL